MEEALRAQKQGNVDVGLPQKTKLIDRIHVRQGEGYSIWATEAEIKYGGVNIGSLEGARGVADGGDYHLWTNRGKLLADVGVTEIVHCRGIRAPTR